MEALLSDGALDHPIFDPVRPALVRLAREPGWPDPGRLNRLTTELGGAPRTESGFAVRFVEPVGNARASYELRVFTSGCVQTRPTNWHDLFNALVWLAFPCTKARLNALHAAAIPCENGRRGRLRDMLTLFDEGGAIVAYADPEFARLIRSFRWRTLFWEQRARVLSQLRFVVLGHAVLEKALAPWPGIACRALLLKVDRAALAAPIAKFVAGLDARASEWLTARAKDGTPQALAPLPLFGYPGWLPENAVAKFYDDTRYFRAPPFKAHSK